MLVNHQWFGKDPAGYHATGIALHALVTLLVYLLAARTLKDRMAAGFAALFFAVHPLHVESVAFVSGINDPEFTLFALAAMLCFLRWRDGGGYRRSAVGGQPAASDKQQAASSRLRAASDKHQIAGHLTDDGSTSASAGHKWLFLSLACYALSLLSKETALVLCPLIFVYEWRWAAGSREPTTDNRQPATDSRSPAALRALLVTLPYLAVTGMYLAARFLALWGLAPGATNRSSRAQMLMSLPAVLWFYLRKMIWPLPMSLFYPLRTVTHANLANFAWPLAASVAVLAGLWIWSRRSAAAGMAAAWMVLPLALPLLATTRFRFYDLVHDRYLYLPSAGLVMLMALAVRRLPSPARPDRRPTTGAAGALPALQLGCVAVLGIVLGGTTIGQAQYWSGSLPLYTHGVEVAPRNPLALRGLSSAVALQRHDPRTARQLEERSLAEDPNDYDAVVGEGVLLRNAGEYGGALKMFLHARDLSPNAQGPHMYLGILYADMGQLGNSEAELHEAIRLLPHQPGQHDFLGSVYERENRLAEARSEYQTELQIQPGSTHAASRLAALQGR
jgi:Flp pilus assembly protein TadD